MKVGLIVIDGQKDFVEGGNLAVTGGNKALSNVAKMIRRVKGDLFSIDCTMDTHHRHHIGHSRMWVNNKGEHPSPFVTQMKPADVIGTRAIWRAANIAWPEKA